MSSWGVASSTAGHTSRASRSFGFVFKTAVLCVSRRTQGVVSFAVGYRTRAARMVSRHRGPTPRSSGECVVSFKEKLAAYKAGKAQRGGLAGRSPSLPAVPTAVKERTAAVGMREKKAEAAGSSSTTRRSSKVVSGGLQSSGSSGAPRSAFSDVQRTRTAGETRAEPASKSAASETSGMKPEEQSVSELYIHMDSFPRDAATFQDRPAETAGVAAVAATDGPWFEPPVVSFPEKSGGERRGRHHGDKLPQLPSFYVSLHKEICCLLKLIRPTKVRFQSFSDKKNKVSARNSPRPGEGWTFALSARASANQVTSLSRHENFHGAGEASTTRVLRLCFA